jgi:GDP-mannose transporter
LQAPPYDFCVAAPQQFTFFLRKLDFTLYLQAYTVLQQPALRNPIFVAAAILSSLLAMSISFASLWFLSTTTATTYSLVGSLNKIPVAILGLVAFNVPWSAENLASVLVGLVAGIVFVQAKQRE